MIARVLLAAIVAGMIAGAITTAIHVWRVVPLILQAEAYETAAAGIAHSHADRNAGEAAGSHGASEPWVPQDGLERTVYTLMSNIVMGAAFSLILVAAVIFTGREITPQNGFIWGLLGFLVFTLAPSSGLAPELPGMPATDLTARQVWWWATVAATGAGISLIALNAALLAKAAGAILIAGPHIVGAPHPETLESTVPATLAADFAAASIASMALFWILLGMTSGWLLNRGQPPTKE